MIKYKMDQLPQGNHRLGFARTDRVAEYTKFWRLLIHRVAVRWR